MESIWLTDKQCQRACRRNEAFWTGELEEMPLLWVTVSNAKPGTPPPAPPTDEGVWTDPDYLLSKAEYDLSHSYYAGDALPVHHPWLGPDQFACWLGADMTIVPADNTAWVRPFVDNWSVLPQFSMDPENRWWKLYLCLVRDSVEAGKGKWVTAYPDLHTGIDGLAALRGVENLMIDLVTQPEMIQRAMSRMTQLWKEIVDTVSEIVLPAGQGTSNWTMGWSRGRFLCVGHNDFTCMISTEMFDRFCLEDNIECCNHVDRTIYHLDGPGAIRHVPRLCEIEKLDCVQWIQGAGKPLPSAWLDLLKRIQDAGKTVQLYYGGAHGGDADFKSEIEVLCRELDYRRLFIWIAATSVDQADLIVEHARRACLEKDGRRKAGRADYCL